LADFATQGLLGVANAQRKQAVDRHQAGEDQKPTEADGHDSFVRSLSDFLQERGHCWQRTAANERDAVRSERSILRLIRL